MAWLARWQIWRLSISILLVWTTVSCHKTLLASPFFVDLVSGVVTKIELSHVAEIIEKLFKSGHLCTDLVEWVPPQETAHHNSMEQLDFCPTSCCRTSKTSLQKHTILPLLELDRPRQVSYPKRRTFCGAYYASRIHLECSECRLTATAAGTKDVNWCIWYHYVEDGLASSVDIFV